MTHVKVNHLDLSAQRALVTGANSGIGAGVARGLAAAGATVVLNYVSGKEQAQKIADEIIEAGGRAMIAYADVSDEADVQSMFGTVQDRLGGLDILVNNAGLQQDAPFQDMTLAQWNKVIGVNLTGQFLCARQAVRMFLQQGVNLAVSSAAGKIVCISSVHDRIPWATHANYAASKGGVMLLMQTMAQELAGKMIRINSISPGAIKTSINRDAWDTPEHEHDLLKLIPYYRVGETDDIARAVVWLASDHSDYVTGATLYVDGGMTLYPEFRGGG
jgi:glucose 1-dehydrogenase